ncbi:TrkA C-terminal domain-containing protein [Halosimplex rubrum]|uniref:TrkA C-terminal domain-containing protein n=1 Tax=Halosimplex rubrum TaxID=869889 RepID=A0A7D5NXZ8_9EURY|nr:TrkA C-terminal domain-containing protein [Halosimplex rubrum]QLH75817.1 TrkA C-terminal domain-containing protein [Halosimplex rubrum]
MSVAVPLQLASEWTTTALLRILGFALYASVVAMGVSFLYRGYSTRPLPVGVGVVVGLSFVTMSLNIDAVARASIIGDTAKLHYATASYLLGVFAVGAVGADAGRRIGDHLAANVFDVTRVDAGGQVARLVQSAGLVVELELPETVDDIDGYPPVDEETERALAGRRMRFPRRLSESKLESRLAARLERDFDVGHVHAAIEPDLTVSSLAVGRRPSGIGPSLPPGTVAVAVSGDPAPDASTGDPVEVWTGGEDGGDLVATGKFRASVGDVATVAVGADDADAFDPDDSYRLVTRPDTAEDVNELVATVWEADETVTAVTVDEGDPLQGEFVDWLPVSVLTVVRDGEPIPFPADNETLAVGDTVYVLGTPAGLHRLAEYEPEREPGDRPADADDAERPAADGDDAAAEAGGDDGGLASMFSDD